MRVTSNAGNNPIRWMARRLGLCLLLGVAMNAVVVVVSALIAPYLVSQSTSGGYVCPGSQDSVIGVLRERSLLREDRIMLARNERPPGRPGLPGVTRGVPSVREQWALAYEQAKALDPWLGWGVLPSLAVGDVWPSSDLRIDRACGWPVVSAWCELEYAGQPVWDSVSGVKGGLEFSGSSGTSVLNEFRCIPLRPIWRGIAINTLFYATLLVVPLVIWPLLQMKQRVRGGRCGWCGYDLRGDIAGGCPECGWGRDGRA